MSGSISCESTKAPGLRRVVMEDLRIRLGQHQFAVRAGGVHERFCGMAGLEDVEDRQLPLAVVPLSFRGPLLPLNRLPVRETLFRLLLCFPEEAELPVVIANKSLNTELPLARVSRPCW